MLVEAPGLTTRNIGRYRGSTSPYLASINVAPLELVEVSATESCCWICENWVEQEVCYIPGKLCEFTE